MATSALTVTGQIDPTITTKTNAVPAFLPLILPLAILVLPLLDFTLAVLRRLRAGKSPFAADKTTFTTDSRTLATATWVLSWFLRLDRVDFHHLSALLPYSGPERLVLLCTRPGCIPGLHRLANH